MRLLNITLLIMFCVCAVSYALEQNDEAIVGVWLLDGNYDDASGNGNDGKENGSFKFAELTHY